MWNWIHRWGSPPEFYGMSGRILPWFAVLTVLLFAIGLPWALVIAPEDYQQGNSVRIMYTVSYTHLTLPTKRIV